MSLHIYRQDNVEVRMGYDRPLDFVFMTVEKDGEMVYSNLDDPEAGTEQQDVEYYRTVLVGLRIQVPEEMFAEVAYDQANKTGNRVMQHRRLNSEGTCGSCKDE